MSSSSSSSSSMKLGPNQRDLLAKYDTDLRTGLRNTDLGTYHSTADNNHVPPPLDCPSWVCCLLPCIKSLPAMKLFRQIEPEEAEVLRDGSWVCYDAASVLLGDVVRLKEGDLVPADCTVLTLHEEGVTEDLVVDTSDVTGEIAPRVASLREDGTTSPTRLFYGSFVTRGSALALVTATGTDTVLAKLIRRKRWPPDTDLTSEIEIDDDDHSDVELRSSLLR